MKWLGVLFGVLTTLIVGIYVMLFTSVGHGILLPIATEKIESSSKVKSASFEKFNLSMNQIDMVLNLDGEIVKVNGHYDLFTSNLDLNYEVIVKNIATFKNLINQPIQGDLSTSGRVWGKFDNILVKGIANVAKGNIDYNLNLNGEDIVDINFDLKNVSVQKLLWMVQQPLYTDAKLFSKGKINSLKKLDGDIITIVKDGLLNIPVVKKQFDIDLPENATYDLHVKTSLKNNKAVSSIDFNSFLATVDTLKTVYNLDKGSLVTDYVVTIDSLKKIYFITQQKMRGDIKVTGDVKFDKKLLATFNIDKFNGNVMGKLDGNLLEVNTKSLQIEELLHMLYYPEIFKSQVDIDLDYNLATKKGTSKLTSTKGQFLTNKTTKMLKRFTSYDLTLEVYKNIDLQTKINEKFLENNLLMESKKSKIESKKLNLDMKKSIIDADLDLSYRKYEVDVKLNGDLKDPTVKVNSSKILKQKAKDELNKQLEKRLGDKMNENVGGFLKNLF